MSSLTREELKNFMHVQHYYYNYYCMCTIIITSYIAIGVHAHNNYLLLYNYIDTKYITLCFKVQDMKYL